MHFSKQDKLNKQVAVFIARQLLGLIFFLQGWGKVFNWTVGGVYQSGFATYEKFFPNFLLMFTAYFTSYAELIGGALLILGLFRNYALYALGLVLVIVTFGHGVATPIWDLSDVMWRTILLVFLLAVPHNWDTWALDKLREKEKLS